jgi:hypothetical protein
MPSAPWGGETGVVALVTRRGMLQGEFSACTHWGRCEMVRHPIESNFYVNISESDVEVIFAPTRSRYNYSRLEASLDLLSPTAVVQHTGRTGDTGDYEPGEVQAMAYRVALATMRRLKRTGARPAL